MLMVNQVIALAIGAYLDLIGHNKNDAKVLSLVIHDNLCFSQMSQVSPLYKGLAYSLVSFISGL
jgi:hypothetical protein